MREESPEPGQGRSVNAGTCRSHTDTPTKVSGSRPIIAGTRMLEPWRRRGALLLIHSLGGSTVTCHAVVCIRRADIPCVW